MGLSSESSGSRRISLALLHEWTRRKIRLCEFHAYWYRDRNCNSPLKNTTRWLSTANIILESFVSWFYTTAFLSWFPFLASKIVTSKILLDTFFHHGLQSVIIMSNFLQKNLQVVQSQYGLKFLRFSYSLFGQSFQDVITRDLRHGPWNSVPLGVEFLNIITSENDIE